MSDFKTINFSGERHRPEWKVSVEMLERLAKKPPPTQRPYWEDEPQDCPFAIEEDDRDEVQP